MLVLSRKCGETVLIGDNVEVMVTSVHGDRVRLGITAPKDVPIHRKELLKKIQRQQEGAHGPQTTELSSASPAPGRVEQTEPPAP